jgi:hypothetical protein
MSDFIVEIDQYKNWGIPNITLAESSWGSFPSWYFTTRHKWFPNRKILKHNFSELNILCLDTVLLGSYKYKYFGIRETVELALSTN